MTPPPNDSAESPRGARQFDSVAALLFAVGVLLLLRISRLLFLRQDANWDLLNYHAYVPASLLDGSWYTDFHPVGGTVSYLAPYQDLLAWPLISALPAPIGTALLMAVQVSIFIPIGLIVQVVAPDITRWRAMGVALVGVSGAMTMSELGSTMGDIPPAVLMAWALYLLLSVAAGRAPRPERRACLAGLLVGGAVALKLSSALVAPGLLAMAMALALADKRRSALAFVLSAPLASLVFYAPWGIVLQVHAGSPVFPLFNALFQAPRYPPVNFQDPRFAVTGLADMLLLPLRLAQGQAHTAELPFTDTRWALALIAAGLGTAISIFRGMRARATAAWRRHLPSLALIAFWGLSLMTWEYAFGIQRYAIILEVLAVPIMVVGIRLAWPRIPNPASLLMLLIVAALLAGTTSPVDFGRRPMGWSPIVPSQTIDPLARYEAVVAGSLSVAYLAAVTRDAQGAHGQVWIGRPFNEADRVVAQDVLRGRLAGIVYYPRDRYRAEVVAGELGLQIADDCQSFDSPLWNDSIGRTIVVCSTVPAP